MTSTVASPHTEELLSALDGLEATLAEVRRAAGKGASPELERALRGHLRSLRALAGSGVSPLVEDAVDAALRVLDCADPAAPLHVLSMTQQGLAGTIRRHAAAMALPTAA